MPPTILGTLFVLLVLLDCIDISDLRRLLIGILIHERNRKSANRIYKEQEPLARITLSYLPLHLKKNRQYFSRFYRLYHAELISLLPQYLLLILFTALWGVQSRFAFYGFAGIKLLLGVIVSLQVDGLWRPNRLKE